VWASLTAPAYAWRGDDFRDVRFPEFGEARPKGAATIEKQQKAPTSRNIPAKKPERS
jgi:hypothetical protein